MIVFFLHHYVRKPITIHGRQGMEMVEFWEKTTAARAFGHLHELSTGERAAVTEERTEINIGGAGRGRGVSAVR